MQHDFFHIPTPHVCRRIDCKVQHLRSSKKKSTDIFTPPSRSVLDTFPWHLPHGDARRRNKADRYVGHRPTDVLLRVLVFTMPCFPAGTIPAVGANFFSPRPRSLKLKWKRGFRRFLAKCKPAIAKRNKTHADIVASRTDAFVEPASWRNNIDLSVPQAHQRVSDNNEFMIFCPYSLVVNLGRFAPAPWVTMVGLVDAIFVS